MKKVISEKYVSNEDLKKLGGKHWEKNGEMRVYFSGKKLLELAGVKVDFYKTGNVCSCEKDGEPYMSNGRANKVLGSSVWYCLKSDKWYTYDLTEERVLEDALASLSFDFEAEMKHLKEKMADVLRKKGDTGNVSITLNFNL